MVVASEAGLAFFFFFSAGACSACSFFVFERGRQEN